MLNDSRITVVKPFLRMLRRDRRIAGACRHRPVTYGCCAPNAMESMPGKSAMKHRSQQATGFTLVELLVVVSIIALLLSVLLPAMSSVRAVAMTTQCLANLRQIGLSSASYEMDFGALPWGTYYDPDPSLGTNWPILLSSYALNTGTTYQQAGYLKSHRCPSARFANDGTHHYGAHPALMPDGAQNTDPMHAQPWTQSPEPYRLEEITRPAEVFLFADAGQFANQTLMNFGNSKYTLKPEATVAGGTVNYDVWFKSFRYEYWSSQGVMGEPIDFGPNTDPLDTSTPGAHDVRWRHYDNAVSNWLFADGHVKSAYDGDIRVSNLVVQAP